MPDFLTAVKSVHSQNPSGPGDTFLTEVKSNRPITESSATNDSESGVQRSQKQDSAESRNIEVATSPSEALEVLRSKPSQDTLLAILNQLTKSNAFGIGFNIDASGPLHAQIINALLNIIVPDFWPVLQQEERLNLVTCLRNVAGLNAVVARLRLLSSEKAQDRSQNNTSQSAAQLDIVLQVASIIFDGVQVLSRVWLRLQDAIPDDATKRYMTWKECVNLVGSGKVIAAVAQADDAVNKSRGGTRPATWLGDGCQYATWLGKNIADMVSTPVNANVNGETSREAAAQILARSMNLGYPEQLLKGLFKPLVQHELERKDGQGDVITPLIHCLSTPAARSLVEHTLRWLSSLMAFEGRQTEQQSRDVQAIAGLLSFLATRDTTKKQVHTFLSDPAFSSTLSVTTLRACLAYLATDAGDGLQDLLEKMLAMFSSSIFINHSPILYQDSLAQTILIAAGYVHRATPMALLMTARSSNHMQGVTNRLESSNQRARWLGMLVGTALSSLVDKQGSKMSFGTEEMETEEAKEWLQLVHVDDKVGSLQDFAGFLDAQTTLLETSNRTRRQQKVEQLPKINGKQVFGPPRPPKPAQTEVIGEKVTELLDSDNDDGDNDLKPYAKPDSDPEDSDEDATLVNRNKPRAPVYIRDLMSMLRDDKNHDRFQLGVKHAAALIRRKTNFGAEVKDHAEELAGILCALQDPFDTEDFDELKLQALIAVLLSDVKIMAPWLSRQAFTGEYSVAQRCVMLSALGLGGRELAGLKIDDETLNPAQYNTDFPSKRLPAHLQTIYSPQAAASSTKRLEAASKDMEQSLIQPLALQAADKSTAHLNAVKVRNFSSRMDVERTKRKPAPNQLAKVFAECFFFPLVNRYQQEIASYGSVSVFSSVPFVLVTFLKTVALLIHASGPTTLNLPVITSEFWDLILSLRVQAISDISILQSVLFSLLTLLEMNTDKRRIAQEHPKQLMETQQWVDMVFERTGGGQLISESGDTDGAKVRTLAAGVLVKCKEVIDAYQKDLVGYSI